MFVHVTADVDVADADVADYHARNPLRFAAQSDAGNGWRTATVDAPPLDAVRPVDRRASAWRRPATRVPAVARRAARRAGSARPRLRASRRSPSARQHPQALMAGPGTGPRHRRHQDRRRARRRGRASCGHHAQLPTPDGDAEAIWAVVDSLVTEALAAAGGSRPRCRHRVGGPDRPAVGHRQPDQHHRVATLSDRRAGDRSWSGAPVRLGGDGLCMALGERWRGAGPRRRSSCSAWWCRPASAAAWCSTARPTTAAPATPGTSATSSSTPTERRARAVAAAAWRRSRRARTWRGGPARTAGTRLGGRRQGAGRGRQRG